MRIRSFYVLVAGVGLLLTTSPLLAHHWFPRESDTPIKMAGTVTKLVWVNPHVSFFIDVKDEAGKVRNWEIELGSVGALVSRGWNRDALKFADAVSVDGYVVKGKPNMLVARCVQFAGGRRVFAGSHAGDLPDPAATERAVCPQSR